MEFKTQDILKNIIPGFALLFVIIFCQIIIPDLTDYYLKKYDLDKLGEVLVIFILAICFILGYLIDAISSWIELGLYELQIINRPSYKLLSDKCSKKYKLNYRKEIIDKLSPNSSSVTPPIKPISKERAYELFKIANDLAKRNEALKEKIGEYYSSYIFARNFLVSLIISLIFYVITYWLNSDKFCSGIFTIIAVFLLLMFFRWKQKAMYYGRQIFCSIDI